MYAFVAAAGLAGVVMQKARPDLDGQTVPHVVAELRQVRGDSAFQRMALWLYVKRAKPSIPVLIDSLAWRFRSFEPLRQPPALSALRLWDNDAVDALIRGTRDRRELVRVWSARLLAEHPVDRRLAPLFGRLARSDDPALRTAAAQGFWNLAVTTRIWSMDGVYEITVDNPGALRGVIDAAVSDDAGEAEFGVSTLTKLLWSHDRSIAMPDRLLGTSPMRANGKKAAAFLVNDSAPLRAAAVVLQEPFEGLDAARVHALSDPDPLVAHAAIVSAAWKVAPYQIAWLTPLASSASAQVRAGVARLLGLTLSEKALPALRQLAGDSDADVRSTAREAIRDVMLLG